MSTKEEKKAELIPGISQDGKIQIYGDHKAVNAIKARLCPEASVDELVQFAIECDTTQLNPYRNQIYLVPRYDSRAGRKVCRTQVGIDGLRLVAQRTNEFGGRESVEWCGADGKWVDVWLSQNPPAAARCAVRKLINGQSFIVSHVVLYSAYVQETKNGSPMARWKSDPAGQLAKCAEAGALRAAFPQELGSLMTAEEMDQSDNGHRDEIDSERKNVTPDIAEGEATVQDPEVVTEEEVLDPKPKPETASEFEESLNDEGADESDTQDEPSTPTDWVKDEGQLDRKNVTPEGEGEDQEEDDYSVTDAFIEKNGLTAKALAAAACARSKDKADGLLRAKAIIESFKEGAKFAELSVEQQRQAIHKSLNIQDKS